MSEDRITLLSMSMSEKHQRLLVAAGFKPTIAGLRAFVALEQKPKIKGLGPSVLETLIGTLAQFDAEGKR